MQILARPKNTTSKTAFILYINVLEHRNRIKNSLVSKVDFEHPTLQGEYTNCLVHMALPYAMCFWAFSPPVM